MRERKFTKPESVRKWIVRGQAWSIEGLGHPHPQQSGGRGIECPAENKDSGHSPVHRMNDQTWSKPHSSFDRDKGNVVQPCKFRSGHKSIYARLILDKHFPTDLWKFYLSISSRSRGLTTSFLFSALKSANSGKFELGHFSCELRELDLRGKTVAM